MYYFDFRYTQSSSQSHTQPRLPQPVPSDSSVSSRDWNQRQERSMPGSQQNYQQPEQNFGQNYDNPPRGFNNDQRGKYVTSIFLLFYRSNGPVLGLFSITS